MVLNKIMRNFLIQKNKLKKEFQNKEHKLTKLYKKIYKMIKINHGLCLRKNFSKLKYYRLRKKVIKQLRIYRKSKNKSKKDIGRYNRRMEKN